MNLHEYQAKSILKKFKIPIPYGVLIEHKDDAKRAALNIQKKTQTQSWAVKAQIHSGGRGKAGGIKIARNINEVEEYVTQILGSRLITNQTGKEGKLVHKILIEQDIYYTGNYSIQEYYISIILNRNTGKYEIIYSTEGGMDIEQVAVEFPDAIYREEIHPFEGIMLFQARKIAYNLKLFGNVASQMIDFVMNLYQAYVHYDATLIEINPLVKTSDNILYAADAKIIIDDNALYRQSILVAMRDENEENAIEVEASKYGLNFIKLEGDVGCIVNGAGLAMATMDMIKLSGGNPANFLDIGGGANIKTIEVGLKILLKDKNVKTILVNIFGGIVRCDKVAKGIIEAYKNIGHVNKPIIVRLQGTNAIEAKKILDNSGLKILFANNIEEAILLLQKVLN